MTFSQSTHPGNMPIRVLQYNVIHHFESVRDDAIQRLQEWVNKGKIKPGIKWLIEKEKVRTPYADCVSKEIAIQEVFLSYIWAITYALVVIYEEAIQKKMIAGKWSRAIELDTPLLQDAEKLFIWALTLTDKYSDWDRNLPNPESQKTDEVRFYAGKINGIFLDIIVFILFHECCHLVNEHCEFIRKLGNKSVSELTAEEKENYKALENEADLFAIESIISNADGDRYKLVKGLFLVLANISILFILKHPKMVKSITHPDVDTRLHNVLEYLGHDLPTFDYVWYLACFACRIFFGFHNIPVKSEPANDSIELFYRYLAVFDSIKG
jgi:hypothetical protein